jgi:hypothetical protein
MAIGTANGPGRSGGELTRRQRYETMRGALIQERASFDSHWKELGDYFFPRRTRFWVTDRNKGDRRSQNIINSTPRLAARTLQSGLHAGLTSPARPWMRLTTPDPDLAEHGAVKEWLHTVTQRMLTVFLRSNLYNALPTLYGDLGVFGTGAMAVMADEREMLRSYTYPIGSYAVGIDARGVATTFVRDYEITVRQAVEAFGAIPGTRDIDWTKLSEVVRSAWDKSQYDLPVEITWLVTPNTEYVAGSPWSREFRWHSCYFERGRPDDGIFLRESGFKQFPILVPRWDVTGEDTYGTASPGMDALGDAKGLQLLERRKARAIDKALDPPLVGPSTLRTQKTSLIPGDITYDDAGSRGSGQGLRPIHEVRLEGLQHVAMEIERHEYRVQRSFYADLFLMLAQSDSMRGAQPVTAREIEERHEEKLLALGPVLERMNDELLDPLVDRTFSLMLDAGAIPEPPEELHGVDLKVEYISVMAQAQKLVGVVGLDRFLQSSLLLAEKFPAVLHKVNAMQAINDYQDMLGVNPKLVVPDDEAQAGVDADRQAMAQQAGAEQAQRMAQAGAALGKTPLGGNTALDAMLNAAGSVGVGA